MTVTFARLLDFGWIGLAAAMAVGSMGCHSNARQPISSVSSIPPVVCETPIEGLPAPQRRDDLFTFVVPPVGWRADPVKSDDRHTHQVWISPSGDTAYGVILMVLPWPVGPDLTLWGFLQSMQKSEGRAEVLSKTKDNALPGYRFVVDGSQYKLRVTLIVHDWKAWAIYAGTMRANPVVEDELELAEKARDDTRVITDR